MEIHTTISTIFKYIEDLDTQYNNTKKYSYHKIAYDNLTTNVSISIF